MNGLNEWNPPNAYSISIIVISSSRRARARIIMSLGLRTGQKCLLLRLVKIDCLGLDCLMVVQFTKTIRYASHHLVDQPTFRGVYERMFGSGIRQFCSPGAISGHWREMVPPDVVILGNFASENDDVLWWFLPSKDHLFYAEAMMAIIHDNESLGKRTHFYLWPFSLTSGYRPDKITRTCFRKPALHSLNWSVFFLIRGLIKTSSSKFGFCFSYLTENGP